MVRATIFCVGLFLVTIGLGADAVIQFDARTGDASLDVRLKDLDVAARANLPQFGVDMKQAYAIPNTQVDVLLGKRMAPADIYMAAKVAKVTKKPMGDVVQEFEKSQGKGWGVIAKNMGIKPGSKEFHELKSDESGLLEKSKGKGDKEGVTEVGQNEVKDKGAGESKEEGNGSKGQGKGNSESKGKNKKK